MMYRVTHRTSPAYPSYWSTTDIEADSLSCGMNGALFLNRKTGRKIKEKAPFDGGELVDEMETVAVYARAWWTKAELIDGPARPETVDRVNAGRETESDGAAT